MIGPAGSGKTTISKRVVIKTLDEKRHCFLVPLAYIKPDDNISLKQLLLSFPMILFANEVLVKEHDLDVAFKWLLKNQNKITIIFDGLDQARFTLEDLKVQSAVDVNKKYLPSELLFFILSRSLIPDVRLIVTSRPHSILNFVPINYYKYCKKNLLKT